MSLSSQFGRGQELSLSDFFSLTSNHNILISTIKFFSKEKFISIIELVHKPVPCHTVEDALCYVKVSRIYPVLFITKGFNHNASNMELKGPANIARNHLRLQFSI